jgi:hypothetical protein
MQTAYDEESARLSKEESRLVAAERLLDDAESSLEGAAASAERLRRLTADIESSYERQQLLREQLRDAFGRFSRAFEHVARALLGDDIHARVEGAGRSLALHVERDGDRDSAAITTVKLLAFDLAALTMSVEGHGHFPRLLVHDGPREADLAPDIYDRLFLYAQELERCFEAEPGFQYILTTTTEPPATAAREPWLRLQISGASSEERLFRMDF